MTVQSPAYSTEGGFLRPLIFRVKVAELVDVTVIAQSSGLLCEKGDVILKIRLGLVWYTEHLIPLSNYELIASIVQVVVESGSQF